MANQVSVPGDLVVPGNLRLNGSMSPLLAKSSCLALASQTYTIPMSIWRKFDAYATFLSGSPATDDLGLIGGTHATNAPSLQTDDFGGNAAAAQYKARGEIQLPAEYNAASSVVIRLHAGMLTTVADQECTVDLTVTSSDEDSTSSANLSTAGVTNNMNSLVFADIDFTITATNLAAGDILDVLIDVTADDNGDAGVMKACIGSVQLICDTR